MSEKEFTVDIIKEIAAGLSQDLDNLIFIGGIASFLYHFKTNTEPVLYTYDLDTVVRNNFTGKLRESIEKIGFVEMPSRERGKSSGKFSTDRWTIKGKRVKIELLLPLKGKPSAWGRIEKGLEAERLRYLDILIDNCWDADLGDGIVINIPHPARFLIQKLLVYEKRKSAEEKEKDAAYIADIINLFFDRLDMFKEEIELMEKRFSEKSETQGWISRAIEKHHELFSNSTSDGAVSASRQLKMAPSIICKQAELFRESLTRRK